MLQWYYFALLSSVLLGAYSIIEKMVLKKEHATAFTSSFSFVAAVLSLPFLLLAKFNLGALQLVLIFINSALIALTYLLAARVYKHGNISIASSAFSTLPTVFVVLLAVPLLGEHLTWIKYISIVVIVLIIYSLIAERRSKKEFDSNKYRTMLVTRSLLVAFQALLTKYLLAGVDVYTFFVLSEVFVAFYFIVFISLKYNGMREILETVRDYLLPVFLMAALTLGYGLMYYLSLLSAPVSLVTPVRNTIYVIITVLAGSALFKEGDLKRKLALCAVLMIFAYLLIA